MQKQQKQLKVGVFLLDLNACIFEYVCHSRLVGTAQGPVNVFV